MANSSQSKQHRKYLGDPSDPHYVPKSPLIERQKFSAQDEAELKHMCSLALADIPHSDDMMDDPFRYLGGHITARAPTKPSNTQQGAKPQVVSESTKAPEYQVPSGASSTTPSETSKRETLQTNVTTPMTTPGVTPGDTDKRFSEGGKRPHTTPALPIKSEVESKGHNVYSFLKDPHTSTKPQLTATKSLTHLPTLSKSKSKHRSPDLPVHTGKSIVSHPDFNKSLPAIPQMSSDESERVIEVEPAQKEKSSGITRMFKTVRLTRAQTSQAIPMRGTSTDQSQNLGRLSKHQSVNSPKKHKFSFSSMFQKRTAVNNKRATVG